MLNFDHSFTAYLGLGSNIGNSQAQILNAIEDLKQIQKIKVIKISSLYQSSPVDGTDQDNYTNAAICIKTLYSPLELLTTCQLVEKKHDKVYLYHWGPRTLDIDILCYEQLVTSTEKLTLPHPEIANRDFVIEPLLEINPKLKLPHLGLLAELPKPKQNILF